MAAPINPLHRPPSPSNPDVALTVTFTGPTDRCFDLIESMRSKSFDHDLDRSGTDTATLRFKIVGARRNLSKVAADLNRLHSTAVNLGLAPGESQVA